MSEPPQADQPTRPAPWVNWLILGAIVLAVYLIFNFRPFDGFGLSEHPAVGHPLRLVELTGLTGTDEVVTRDDLIGRVVLINFWATWCGPCREELPHIAELEKKYRGLPDVKILAVSVGPADSQREREQLTNATAELLSQAKLDLPTYADPGDLTRQTLEATGAAAGRTGTSGVPTTAVLDRSGIVRGVWVGYVPGAEQQMQRLILQLIDETNPPG